MEELFEDLKRYLEEHFISYSILQILNDERPVVIINGEKHQLSLPNNEGSFFDESFCWDSDRTEYDYYIFRFGGIWYRLKAGEESSVKLERILWLGNAEFSEPCLKVDCFLGVHGPFELLNGSGLYKEWCQKANFLGIKSLGICEKGTLAGILKFQEACKKANIRPIFGMEIPIKVEEKDLQYTVKAFVKNEQGWLNILEINRIINVENGYVTEKEIEQLREGLIIILDPKTIEFEDVSKLWKMFSQQFYYQLDTVVYEKEDRDKWYLQNLKKFFDSNFSPIAMCDAYYLEREYAYNRVRLNKIAGTMSYESQNQYFKNNQEYYFELGELFGDFDSFFDVFEAAVNNLKDVCSKCDYTIETGQRHLPKYYMTEEESKLYPDNKTMFTELVFKGMEDHLDLIEDYGIDVVGERIDREIKVITEGDVIDYFLILRDIVNWCKKNNILLGAGRGCFLPGQKVLLKDGTKKNIEDVQIGDNLSTYWNEKNQVINRFEYDCNEEIVELEFEAGIKIQCTKDHQFYTKNRGWVEADKLTEEDNVIYIGPLIYKATNLKTGEIYIGKTTQGLEKRINFHKKDFQNKEIRTPFYESIEKNGWESFLWEIIEYVENPSNLNNREKFYIEEYRSKFGDLVYNIAPGGDGGNIYGVLGSEYMNSIKEKISVGVKTSERWTEEKRKINSERMKNNKLMTPELCKRFSEKNSLSYIVQLSKKGEILHIYDSPLDLKNKTGFIINSINTVAGKSNKSYKGFRWQKFKKNEITKEEIYKLFREGL